MRRAVVTLCVALAAGVAAVAQNPEPAFEVVSIKRNTSLAGGGGGRPVPGGRYVLTNLSVRSLIGMAYAIPSNRIINAPQWAIDERYNIDARAPHPNPRPDEINAMMRTLLRQRFNLSVRREMRDLPIYALVVAKPGARGPKLRPAAVDCSDPEARKKAAAVAPAGSVGGCGFRDAGGRLEGRGLTIDTLAQILTTPAGRPVINRSELQGAYDVDLEWAQTIDATDAVPIFTAVQEQLGLRLQSGTAPMEVVVVERVERPTEN